MGNLGKNFKRFPHTCRITYFDGQITGFETEEEIEAMKKVLFDGICRKEYMSNGTGQDHVIVADYRVQLGKTENGKELVLIIDDDLRKQLEKDIIKSGYKGNEI